MAYMKAPQTVGKNMQNIRNLRTPPYKKKNPLVASGTKPAGADCRMEGHDAAAEKPDSRSTHCGSKQGNLPIIRADCKYTD